MYNNSTKKVWQIYVKNICVACMLNAKNIQRLTCLHEMDYVHVLEVQHVCVHITHTVDMVIVANFAQHSANTTFKNRHTLYVILVYAHNWTYRSCVLQNVC